MGVSRRVVGSVAVVSSVALVTALLAGVPSSAEPSLPSDAPTAIPTAVPSVDSSGMTGQPDEDAAASVQCTLGSFQLRPNAVFAVFAQGDTVYAGTDNGLSISADGGSSWTNYTHKKDGLGSGGAVGVFAQGDTVYVATYRGLSISTDGGQSYTNYEKKDGLGSRHVNGVFAQGDTVYAPTDKGLSISTDGGQSYTNYTKNDGLGDNYVTGVFAQGDTVYAATENGTSISSDGGQSYTNYMSYVDNGLFVQGDTVYSATSIGLAIDSCSAGPVPVVSGMVPAAGGVAGGTPVVIRGSNLDLVDEVSFGTGSGMTVSQDAFTSQSASQIAVVSPPDANAAGGVVTVSLGYASPGGQEASASVPGGFTYMSGVVVEGVAPLQGGIAGGTRVSLAGVGLSQVSKVLFGGVAASIVQQTDNALIVTTPAADAAGTVDVEVVYPSDANTTAPSSTAGSGSTGVSGARDVVSNRGGATSSPVVAEFEYVAPAVSGIAPIGGPVAGGTQVVISGTYLGSVTGVSFGKVPGTDLVVSDDQVTVTSPPGVPGPVTVNVQYPGGGVLPLPQSFTYGAVDVAGVSPTSGPLAGGTKVTIQGPGMLGVTSVLFGSQAGVITAQGAGQGSSDAWLQVTSPAGAAPGPVDITVAGQGSQEVLPDAFTYDLAPCPTVSPGSSASPSASASGSSSPCVSPSPSPTVSPSPTARPTWWPTSTPSPSITPTQFPTRRPSPTASPTASPTTSPTASPSSSGSASPTASPSGSASPTASPSGSASPSASPTASPSASPSPSVTPPPPPPALEYAVPQVTGVPCPPGWSASWQAWANGPVCQVDEDYNSSTDAYPQTYAQASTEGRIYEQDGAKLARVEADPKVGQAVRTHGKAWVATATQKVYFPAEGSTLSDRDAVIAERLVASLQADDQASVRLTGYGPDASTRNARVAAVTTYLTAAGIDPARILTQVGSSAGQGQVSAAVLHPLTGAPRLTTP